MTNQSVSHHSRDRGSSHPYNKYPLLTHERVLGVTISVCQSEIQCEMAGVEYPLGRSSEPVEVNAVGTERVLGQADRAYIGRWARGTLFDGAGPV